MWAPLALTGWAWIVAVSPMASVIVSGVITTSVMPWLLGPVASLEQAMAIQVATAASASQCFLTRTVLCRSDTTSSSLRRNRDNDGSRRPVVGRGGDDHRRAVRRHGLQRDHRGRWVGHERPRAAIDLDRRPV